MDAVVIFFWVFGPLVACAMLIFGAVVFFADAFARRKAPVFWRATGLAAAAFIAFVVSPVGNIFTFSAIADHRAQALLADMRENKVVGGTGEALAQKFGPPTETRNNPGHAEWVYNTNPWYCYGLNHVYVRVEKGQVTAISTATDTF